MMRIAMKIFVDEAIFAAERLFAELGEVHLFQGRALSPSQLHSADALIVRSVTRVDDSLLAASRVRFVGTATSGTDHIDTACLARRNIHFADAAGSNSLAVAEYVFAAILHLCNQQALPPTSRTLGIVGLGRIGKIIQTWAQRLKIPVLACDPPLAAAGHPGLVDFPTLAANADFVTLHVPLTTTGPCPTAEMVTTPWLASLKPGAILINTSRGEISRPHDVISSLTCKKLGGFVADVWRNEPLVDPAFAAKALLATPHIAGYTTESKARAAMMIRDKLALFTGGQKPSESPDFTAPDAGDIILAPARSGWAAAADALCGATGILDVDRRFRESWSGMDAATRFDALRAACARRREFSAWRVTHLERGDTAADWLKTLGFRVV